MATEKLNQLILTGATEARNGNKELALSCFKQVLDLDSRNEAALLWCATLTNDPFEARNYLQRVLDINPRHETARTYYELAQQRCEELNSLLSSSSLIRQWRNEPDPTSIIPRLGQYCIDKTWVTEIQMRAALHYQHHLREIGKKEKLGDIMISFGYITLDQLNQALDHLNTEYNNRFLD